MIDVGIDQSINSENEGEIFPTKKKIFLRNSCPCSEVHILGQEESVCLSSRGGGEEVSWLGSHFKN